MRRLPLIGLLLFASLNFLTETGLPETLPLSTVEFPQALHFLSPGGEDVVIEQGMYEVAQASEWIQYI